MSSTRRSSTSTTTTATNVTASPAVPSDKERLSLSSGDTQLSSRHASNNELAEFPKVDVNGSVNDAYHTDTSSNNGLKSCLKHSQSIHAENNVQAQPNESNNENVQKNKHSKSCNGNATVQSNNIESSENVLTKSDTNIKSLETDLPVAPPRKTISQNAASEKPCDVSLEIPSTLDNETDDAKYQNMLSPTDDSIVESSSDSSSCENGGEASCTVGSVNTLLSVEKTGSSVDSIAGSFLNDVVNALNESTESVNTQSSPTPPSSTPPPNQ